MYLVLKEKEVPVCSVFSSLRPAYTESRLSPYVYSWVLSAKLLGMSIIKVLVR